MKKLFYPLVKNPFSEKEGDRKDREYQGSNYKWSMSKNSEEKADIKASKK